MKKSLYVFSAALVAAAALTACSGSKEAPATTAATQAAASEETKAEETKAAETTGQLEKIVIGATPAPHAEILNAAKDILKE